MKNLILLVCLFQAISSFANDSDSTEIKLQQYKDLFQKGLINEYEYGKLKQGLLFGSSPQIHKDTLAKKSLEDYKKAYIAQFTGGSILFVGGFAALGGGIWYKHNKTPNYLDYYSNGKFSQSTFDNAVKAYKQKYITSFVLGGVTAGIGFTLEILGIHNKVLYESKRKEIALGLSDYNLGLCLNF